MEAQQPALYAYMRILAFVLATLLTDPAHAQRADSSKSAPSITGALTITNNGISLIPSFSLGKPAAMVNLWVGKRKFRFEPELRFSLEGKPWTFLFWLRYHLLETPKFRLHTGMHPAINFRSEPVMVNGSIETQLIARRYLAWELVPVFQLTKNSSIGLYYLYSRGLDPGTTRNNHFLTCNVHFNNLPLPGNCFLSLAPQVYYLKLGNQDGYYASATVALFKKNCPLSLQSILNKSLRTDVVSKDFLWNLSLVYAFGKN